MTHQPEAPTHEKRRHSLKDRAKKGGAIITSLTALGGLAGPAAGANHSAARPASHEAKQKLQDPHNLPGLKIHLGRERLDQIKASTVELGHRLKPNISNLTNANWAFSCTAVKVSIPGQKDPYIMTAAHCFGATTGELSGAFIDSHHPKNKAENFTNVSFDDYAVLDPNETNLSQRTSQPVAIIDEVSIDTNDTDVALLHPVAVDPSSITSPLVRQFEDIPAIPLSVAEEAPIAGTPVALYGEPQANNFEPVADDGVYLGRVSIEVGNTSSRSNKIVYRQLDLVGINPADPKVDNCNFGTSGSMALLPNGKLLGNLTIRLNGGYWGPNAQNQYQDTPAGNDYWRSLWEQDLGIDMADFSTICGYSVMDASTPADLIEGFKHPAPQLTGKGGVIPPIHGGK